MFYRLWIRRVSFGRLFQLSARFSLFSLILAVAALTTAILTVEGFSNGLKRAVQDVSGHILVLADEPIPPANLQEILQPYQEIVQNRTDFLSFEGLILKDGAFKGVLFEGADFSSLNKNPRFLKRLGALPSSLSDKAPIAQQQAPPLIVGRALAQELRLSVGSSVSVAAPRPQSGQRLSRTQGSFTVAAAADFGRYALNSRYVIMSLPAAQKLKARRADSPPLEAVSGSRLWLKNPDLAETAAADIRMTNPGLSVASWRDMESRFFDVIEMDKRVIFFVLLVLVAAAGFNVSGALWTAVFRRTREISVLKATGASPRLIAGLFLMEGLLLGLTGAVCGIFLGYGVCRALFWTQDRLNFIPSDIYPVNEIPIRLIGSSDIPLVFASALAVSLIASLFPALQAYQKDVTEGLKWS